MSSEQYRVFAERVVEEIASACGISYEQLIHTQYPRTVITPRMVQLCSSGDPRKIKRGVRLYYAANGLDVSHSALTMLVTREHMKRIKITIDPTFIDPTKG